MLDGSTWLNLHPNLQMFNNICVEVRQLYIQHGLIVKAAGVIG